MPMQQQLKNPFVTTAPVRVVPYTYVTNRNMRHPYAHEFAIYEFII